MKRLLSICLIICLLLAMIPAVSVAETKYGVVQGGWLRLRAAASFEAQTISSYYTGTVVTVLGTSGSWYKVQAPDGRTGYMYSAYLSVGTSSGSGTTSGTSARVWSSNGYGVRLRSGPGTGYRVLGVYPVGTSLTVVERGSYWSRIQIGGQAGYMMNQFITGGGTPTPTPSGTGNAVIWSWNGYGVRLRTGPSKSHSIIGVYSVGTRVTILERGAVWDKIMVGSRVGYMMNEFLHYYPNTEVTHVTLNNMHPVVGDKLSVLTITPAGAEVKYSWLVNNVEKGTGETYTVASGDETYTIQLKVTGTGIYTGSATSAATAKVLGATQIQGVTLNIPAGESPTVGDVLKMASILPAGAAVSYEWYVGTSVASTAETYTVKKEDEGKEIYLKVTGTGEYKGSKESDKTGEVVLTAEVSNVDIYANGSTLVTNKSVNVTDKLTIKTTPALANGTLTWSKRQLGSGSLVKLSTGSQLTLSPQEAGWIIVAEFKAASPYYRDWTVETDIVTNLPVIQGVTIDKTTNLVYDGPTTVTLTATATLTPTSTASVDYIWMQDGVDTGIRGATYTLAGDDVGCRISVQATGVAGVSVGDKTSASTDIVRGIVRGVSLAITSSGVLEAVLTPADAAGKVNVKWEYYDAASDTTTEVANGTSTTLAVKNGAAGDRITVTVTKGTYCDCFPSPLTAMRNDLDIAPAAASLDLEDADEIDPDGSDAELVPDPGTESGDDPDGVINSENPPEENPLEENPSEGTTPEGDPAEDGPGEIITTVTNEETGAQGTIITPGIIDDTTDAGEESEDQQVLVSPSQEENSGGSQIITPGDSGASNEPSYDVIWINQNNGRLTVGGLDGTENVSYSWRGYKGKTSNNTSYKLTGSEPAGTTISVTVIVTAANGTVTGTYAASYAVKGTEVSKTTVDTGSGTGTIITPGSVDESLDDGSGILTPDNFWPLW